MALSQSSISLIGVASTTCWKILFSLSFSNLKTSTLFVTFLFLFFSSFFSFANFSSYFWFSTSIFEKIVSVAFLYLSFLSSDIWNSFQVLSLVWRLSLMTQVMANYHQALITGLNSGVSIQSWKSSSYLTSIFSITFSNVIFELFSPIA